MSCPNALQWTVTAGNGVAVHCTIRRTEHDPDFIESLEQFVENWRIGLESGIGRIASAQAVTAGCDCGVWMA